MQIRTEKHNKPSPQLHQNLSMLKRNSINSKSHKNLSIQLISIHLYNINNKFQITITKITKTPN